MENEETHGRWPKCDLSHGAKVGLAWPTAVEAQLPLNHKKRRGFRMISQWGRGIDCYDQELTENCELKHHCYSMLTPRGKVGHRESDLPKLTPTAGATI